MDNILYWAIWMWIEETIIPEAFDIACQNVIKEYSKGNTNDEI